MWIWRVLTESEGKGLQLGRKRGPVSVIDKGTENQLFGVDRQIIWHSLQCFEEAMNFGLAGCQQFRNFTLCQISICSILGSTKLVDSINSLPGLALQRLTMNCFQAAVHVGHKALPLS